MRLGTRRLRSKEGLYKENPANARFPRLIRFETKFSPGFGKRQFQGSLRPEEISHEISNIYGVSDPARMLNTRGQLEAIESERYRNALDRRSNLFKLHQLLKDPNGVGRLTETTNSVPEIVRANAVLFGKSDESFDYDRSIAGVSDVIGESQEGQKGGEDAGWRLGPALLRRNRNVLNNPSTLKLVLEELMRE